MKRIETPGRGSRRRLWTRQKTDASMKRIETQTVFYEVRGLALSQKTDASMKRIETTILANRGSISRGQKTDASMKRIETHSTRREAQSAPVVRRQMPR